MSNLNPLDELLVDLVGRNIIKVVDAKEFYLAYIKADNRMHLELMDTDYKRPNHNLCFTAFELLLIEGKNEL